MPIPAVLIMHVCCKISTTKPSFKVSPTTLAQRTRQKTKILSHDHSIHP